MYYVQQASHVTAIRLASTIGKIHVDGYEELQPDELWFGQRAGDLRDGEYDKDGKFIRSPDELLTR